MISALIIVFREVIEAGLIVGIVLAATTGVPGRERRRTGSREVPIPRLWHAVPAYPTINEVWLRLLETYRG